MTRDVPGETIADSAALVTAGYAALRSGDFSNARTKFAAAAELSPRDAAPRHALGVALRRSGDAAAASAAFLDAARLAPAALEPILSASEALLAARDFAAAIEATNRALKIAPGSFQVYGNQAVAYCELGEFQRAEAAFRQAMRLQPDSPWLLRSLSLFFRTQGRADDAIEAARRAVARDFDDAESHHTLALALLSSGHMREGWQEYEWRWKLKNLPTTRIATEKPRLDGASDTSGQTVLVHAEQGIGDTLQFVRYLPELRRRCARVVLWIQEAAYPLLASFPGADRVVWHARDVGPFDAYISTMSLPYVLGLDKIESPTAPYLWPNQQAAAKWQSAFDREPRGPRVRIVWAGNPTHVNDRHRSLSASSFASLVVRYCGQLRFFSLQVGAPDVVGQLRHLPPGSVTDLSPWLTDYAETAGCLAAFDLVVTVDTSVAHLASAMGRPVWLLLPYFSDWRWQHASETTPWYPSMNIYRQNRPGDWDDVFARIATDMANLERPKTDRIVEQPAVHS